LITKRPSYAGIALATIALGIGCSTAIFSVIYSALLKPLPYKDAGRLVLMQTITPEERVPQVSYMDFLDISRQHPGIEAATLFLYDSFVIRERLASGETVPSRTTGLQVTPDFFQVLGVSPKIGRGFLPEETISGKGSVAILSDRLWKNIYGRASTVL